MNLRSESQKLVNFSTKSASEEFLTKKIKCLDLDKFKTIVAALLLHCQNFLINVFYSQAVFAIVLWSVLSSNKKVLNHNLVASKSL